MNKILEISQDFVDNSIKNRFGDGTRYGGMLDEYATHHKALIVLNEVAKKNKKIQISCEIIATYLLELGLKCLSFLSHEDKIYSLSSNEYNAKKKKLSTGIYKILQGNQTNYINVIYPDTLYKLELQNGKMIKNNSDNKHISIDSILMKSILSQDELFAIFKNYAPYPKTHKFIDIFKTIKIDYQEKISNKFKECYCYYLINYTNLANAYEIEQDLVTLSLKEFEHILTVVKNFSECRYLSAGNGYYESHGVLLSALNEATRYTLINIENNY